MFFRQTALRPEKECNTLTKRAKMRKTAHMLFCIVLGISAIEGIFVAMQYADPELPNGIPLLMLLPRPALLALLVLWSAGSVAALATMDRKIFAYDRDNKEFLWDQPTPRRSVRWFMLTCLPQLIMGVLVDIQHTLFFRGAFWGLIVFLFKVLACGSLVGLLTADDQR